MAFSDGERARIENVVRTAATVAARGRPVDEAFLGRIAAEAVNPMLSDEQRVAIATSETEQHVGINRPTNMHSGNPQALTAQAGASGIADRSPLNLLLRQRGGDGDGGGRAAPGSAQYAGMDRNMAQARELALTHKMPWVANNPELLRLGPAAVQALADVHFRKESYDGLKRVGYQAPDVVGLARFAKKKKMDANHLAHEITESNTAAAQKPDGSLDRSMLDRLRRLQTDYMARPDSPDAQKKYDRGMEGLKKEHPHKIEPLNRGMKALGRQAKVERAATAKADEKTVKADEKEKDANDLMASLNASPAAASPVKKAEDQTAEKTEPTKAGDKKIKSAATTQPKSKPLNPKV